MADKDMLYYAMNAPGRMRYNVASFFKRLCLPLGRTAAVFKAGNVRQKTAVCLSYPVMGSGYLLMGKIEKGLGYLLAAALYLWYLIGAGIPGLMGIGMLGGDLFGPGLFVTLLLSVLMSYLYLRSVSHTLTYIERIRQGGIKDKSPLGVLCKRVASGVKTGARTYRETYASSSPAAKFCMIVPFFVMGVSQMLCRQIVKGAILLAIQAAYVFYMILSGGAAFAGLFSLQVSGQTSNYTLAYGLVALFLTIAFFAVYFVSVADGVKNVRKLMSDEKPEDFKTGVFHLLDDKLYKLFLFLPVLGAVLFTILPLVYMICIAFTNYATSSVLGVIPNLQTKTFLSWTGFHSFQVLFSNQTYFSAFSNVLSWTILWAVLATFTCYFGGILLALLINKKIVKCKALFRSLFVLTMAIPQLVSLRVMYALFHDQGPINALLMQWGWISSPISFWGTTGIAKTLIIFVNMWVGIPYFMLLISGLLMNIPGDLYEYAEVEGASRWYAFRKITMPYLLFMTTPLLITNFVSNINNFNVIWLLTGGGPGGQGTGGVAGGTDILITWLYKLTMQGSPDYNLGSAIGIIMFIITATLSLIVYRRSASYKREGEFA